MPEGDTIFRLARRLRAVLVGRGVVRAETDIARLDLGACVGRTVTRVESRGKHLLIGFDDGRVLHTHLGMTGTWRVLRAHQEMTGASRFAARSQHRPSRRLSVGLHVADVVVACFDAAVVELLDDAELTRHARLSRLGPDPLSAGFDADRVLAGLGAQPDRCVGEAIMDQRVIAGIGNVYKSELLFLCRIDPFVRVRAIDEASLRSLLARAEKLLARNVGGGRRTTRFGAGGPRHWVYGRRGEPCLECGERIDMQRQGVAARSTYYCPRCQGVERARERSRAHH